MKTGTRALLIFGSALILTGCIKRPSGVLSDSRMAPVVADMELAEAYINSQPATSEEMRRGLMDNIIAKHGLSREQFDETMEWYGRNPDAFDALADKVGIELAKRKARKTGHESETDGTELWASVQMAMISPLSGGNSFDFDVPYTGGEKGQRLRLRFRMSEQAEGWMEFGVRYKDGSYGYMSRRLPYDRRIDLSLQTDTGRTPEAIFGNLTLDSERNTTLWLDSISITPLPYDSTQYYNIEGQRIYRAPIHRRIPPKTIQDTVSGTEGEVHLQ